MARVMTATPSAQVIGLSPLRSRKEDLQSSSRAIENISHRFISASLSSSETTRKRCTLPEKPITSSRVPFEALSRKSRLRIHGAALEESSLWHEPMIGSEERKRVVSVAAKGRAGDGETAAAALASSSSDEQEVVFFDGGPHYGDLIMNLIFGLSIVWLPLSVSAIARSLFLRYRLTNRRVTVISGFTGEDRKDFTYKDVTDTVCAPRFIGEWGDIVLTLTDKTKIEMKSVPRFREVAAYCEKMTIQANETKGPKGKSSRPATLPPTATAAGAAAAAGGPSISGSGSGSSSTEGPRGF